MLQDGCKPTGVGMPNSSTFTFATGFATSLAWLITVARIVVPATYLAIGCPRSLLWLGTLAGIAAGDAADGAIVRRFGRATRAGDVMDTAADKALPLLLLFCIIGASPAHALPVGLISLALMGELALLVSFSRTWGRGPLTTGLAKSSAALCFSTSIVSVSTDEGFVMLPLLFITTVIATARLWEMIRIYGADSPALQTRR